VSVNICNICNIRFYFWTPDSIDAREHRRQCRMRVISGIKKAPHKIAHAPPLGQEEEVCAHHDTRETDRNNYIG
jgi:hypothetical protein